MTAYPQKILQWLAVIALAMGFTTAVSAQVGVPQAIDLVALFTTPDCTVTNASGIRPKLCGSGNETLGCAQENVVGRHYRGAANPVPPGYAGTPTSGKNILIHPPTPQEQFTRVQFTNIPSVQYWSSRIEHWVLTASIGIGYAQGSTSDGVDVRILAGGQASGCEGPEVLLAEYTQSYLADTRYIVVALPRAFLLRISAYIAIEVRPRANNWYDHLILSNPVLRPESQSISLYSEFPTAGVFKAGFTPLTNNWNSLSGAWATGGAAQVPSGQLTSCAGLLTPGGNNASDSTLVVHPPAPSGISTTVDYHLYNGVPLDDRVASDWVFRARVGLDASSGGDGVTVVVHAMGNNSNSVLEWQALLTRDILPSGYLELQVPLGLWPARDLFHLMIEVRPRANNTDDRLIVEDPVLVGLPPSHGLDNVTEFAFFHGYVSGQYPTGGGLYAHTSTPQFDGIEGSTNRLAIVGEAGYPMDPNRLNEARHLGQKVIWDGGGTFFLWTQPFTLRPDYLQQWQSIRDTFIIPNIDIIEYLYFEELYGNSSLPASQINAVIDMVATLVKADVPSLKVMYFERIDKIEDGVNSGMDLPPSIDVIAFDSHYPTSGSDSPKNIIAGMNLMAKPNHRFYLCPPCIDRSGASEVERWRILNDFFLSQARTDDRYIGIRPFLWWWTTSPVWDGQVPLYYQPPTSSYRRSYMALGKSIRERVNYGEQVVGVSQTMACPSAAHMKVFSAEWVRQGVDYGISLRGAPAHSSVVLSMSLGFGFTPFGCGYLLVDPSLVSWIVVTDAQGRHFSRNPGVNGPLLAFLQGVYLSGDNPVLTRTVRLQYP